MTFGEAIGIVAIIVAIIALPKEKQKWVVSLPKRLGSNLRYWLNNRKCFYATKIYFAKSEQTNEHAYVYVGKSRKFLRDISWELAKWIQVVRIKLGKKESTPQKIVDPGELGVIQVLAVYCNQNPKWERVPRLYRENVSLVPSEAGTTLEQVRRIYDLDTQEPQWQKYHDWHKPVIRLLSDPSNLCQNMKVKLKDLKREYKLSFTPPSGRYNLWGSGASWKWERES